MTIFQFVSIMLFVLTCIIVTYINSLKMIRLRKERDALLESVRFFNNPLYIDALLEKYPNDKDKIVAQKKKSFETFYQILKSEGLSGIL